MWNARINYLTLIILIFIGMFFYNNYVLLFLIIALIILPVISYVLMRMSKDKIEIKIIVNKTSVGKKVPFDVSFSVKNNSVTPMENLTLSVKIKNNFYNNTEINEIIIPSTPFCERRVKLYVDSLYCGRMIIEVINIKCYDLLGLFSYNISLNETSEIMIMPYGAIEIEELPLSLKGESENEELQYIKGDDVSQISQIRNYLPGDKLQNIHWKLSAKEEELQVKEFSMPYSEDIILLVELFVNQDKPEIFDELIEKLFAISLFFIKQRRKFNIIWLKKDEDEMVSIEVNSEDDLLSAIMELYFADIHEVNGITYEIFKKINNNNKGILIYLSDEEGQPSEGEKIDIKSKKVVLTCLY